MKTNRIYRHLLALPLAVVVFSSCSDWLEIKPQNVITKDEFWNEKADVDNMISGLYTIMQSQNVMERMMVWGEYRSDNIAANENTASNANLQNILTESITASNAYTTWDRFYYVINQANTIIDQAPAVAAKDPAFKQSELRADIAECSALRALCYFYLIRTFRDVPYTTTPYYDDNQTMNLPASSFDSVLDSIIIDLERIKDDAVTVWAASSASKRLYQQGRITRDAIYAMLCDMYLWKQDYQKCIEYADKVIADKKSQYEENNIGVNDLSRFNGFPLISDYVSSNGNFGNAYNSIFGSGNSSESIFELVYMADESMLGNGAVNYLYGPSTSGKGYSGPSDPVNETTSNKLSSSQVYYEKDARYYENVYNNSIWKYTYSDGLVNKATLKLASFNRFTNGRVKSNWIVYRLTDVMMMKAEALVALTGNETELTAEDEDRLKGAFALVNAVNKRSVMQSDNELSDTLSVVAYKSKEQMEDLVLAERQRELMFEGKRYFDLVRRTRRDGNTDYIKQRIALKFSSGGSGSSNKFSRTDYIYWPYNVDELKVNKNLKQNAAFGSGESSNIQRN
ncbi:RagB/SusD family protein [Prevotella dentalis DSM 3688]|uniref:Putative outer membrane protein n=1 Tax=Prevotella dentalis (strain ATCC 49559 / DSM 3688 / JCM 13448 / NCTC 12043 / ES 2772) TaxID=908937 RepID=F9D214_PREDD|nr:RagB/SusD family nutrient uptake outer membrane protein [Prevotella dentalis]AGB28359.1 RagB/SusD family protein [Prevotella dentalis DSM 3688]EGQ15832.1 putative outer membrane protein [Prevotella dentalis DSM 3688]